MNSHEDFFEDYKSVYSKLSIVLSFFHLGCVVLFSFVGSNISVIYNIISIIIYIVLSIFFRNPKYGLRCFGIGFLEIALFSALETFVFGYLTGFTLYVLCIIPLTVYLLYSLQYDINKIVFYSIAEVAYCVLILIIGELELFPVIPLSNYVFKIMYFGNMVFCAMLMLSFVLMFIHRVKSSELKLQKENKQLENAANYDSLTKLLNRRTFDHYFDEALDSVSTKSQNFTIMMVDIDNFKRVNDTYGHDAGDEVLKKIALILKCVVRPYDTVFRWGGEEIILLLLADKQDAYEIAERCRERIEQSVLYYEEQEIKITITSGICPYKPSESKDSLIEKADMALYYGKQHGKNQVVIYSDGLSM